MQSEQLAEKESYVKLNKLSKKFIIDWKINGVELDFIKLFALKTKAFLEKEKIFGQIFNIGGGLDNAMSILELLDLLQAKLNIEKLQYKMISRSTSDQDCFIADINKAKRILNWTPKINLEKFLKNNI